MDWKNYYRNKEYIRKKITEKRLNLERVISSNKEYEKIKAEKIAGEEIVARLDKYLIDLNQLKDNVSLEDKEYRNRRIKFLSDQITDMLYRFFPDKGFEAKINFDDKRRVSNAGLKLIDKSGVERNPELSEGMLLQYLISYAAINAVLDSVDKHIIFIDEAFGVASQQNLPKIAEMLQQSCESGMQIILATQNPLLYNSIPHKVFQLELDPVEDKVMVGDVIER